MNAQGLIIDLRQNPGGLLQEAINVSDVFLDSGTIVQTRGRNSSHTFVARKTKKECSLPLILIVDSGSASAAEIFAGAIQENGRGVIVGTPSYGKGTVQAIVQLTGKTQNAKPIAGLRLTTEEFYSPKGRAYGGVGVLPNVEVPYILTPIPASRFELAHIKRTPTNVQIPLTTHLRSRYRHLSYKLQVQETK